MNLYTAIKQKRISLDSDSLRFWGYHIKTRDGRLGTLVKVERNEARSVLMATLKHFNGEPFDHEYAASYCDILERT